MRSIKRKFIFDGNEFATANASSTSEALESLSNYSWSISSIPSDVSGLPQYTVEVSNDNDNWYELNLESTNVPIADAVDCNILPWLFIRINFTSNGATAGTVVFELVQKYT